MTRRLISADRRAERRARRLDRTKQAQLPVLTLAQGRMLLLLGIARGEVLPRDPQAAGTRRRSAARGLGRASASATRALVRRLPGRGPLVRAAVAYAATRALGTARSRRLT